MARAPRLVVPGAAHHVTHRGNNREDIFLDDRARRYYLRLLKEQCETHAVAILGYCLMSNHVHLVLRPASEEGLARVVGVVHQRFATYVNLQNERSGHLWQDRFFSSPMDDGYLWNALRYVELNPVRAGLLSCPWLYPWSSAAAHVKGNDPHGLLDLSAWPNLRGNHDWRDVLSSGMHAFDREQIRAALHTGQPLGAKPFLDQLSNPTPKRPRGRPRKINSND